MGWPRAASPTHRGGRGGGRRGVHRAAGRGARGPCARLHRRALIGVRLGPHGSLLKDRRGLRPPRHPEFDLRVAGRTRAALRFGRGRVCRRAAVVALHRPAASAGVLRGRHKQVLLLKRCRFHPSRCDPIKRLERERRRRREVARAERRSRTLRRDRRAFQYGPRPSVLFLSVPAHSQWRLLRHGPRRNRECWHKRDQARTPNDLRARRAVGLRLAHFHQTRSKQTTRLADPIGARARCALRPYQVRPLTAQRHGVPYVRPCQL